MGGYAEVVLQKKNNFKIPKNISLQHAATIPECYFTVWSNLYERKLTENQKVLVHGGTSGIGISVQILDF